ncbi:MAG: hypothetical protein QXR30_03625 [Candidatus Woesearchaeota archaeon]
MKISDLKKEIVIFTSVPFLFFGLKGEVQNNYKIDFSLETQIFASEFFYDLHKDKDLESRIRFAQDLAAQTLKLIEDSKNPYFALINKFLDMKYIEKVSKDNKIPFSVNMEGFNASIGFYNGYIGLTDEINYEKLKNILPVGAVYRINIVKDFTLGRRYNINRGFVQRPFSDFSNRFWPYVIETKELRDYDYLKKLAALSNNLKFYYHVKDYLSEDQRKKFDENLFRSLTFHTLTSSLIRSYVLVEGVYNIEMIHWANRANYLDIYSFMHSNSLENVVSKIQEARKFYQFPDDIITPVEFSNNPHNLLFIVEQFYQLLNKDHLEEIMNRTKGEFLDKNSLKYLKDSLGYDDQKISDYYERMSDQAKLDLENYVKRFEKYGKSNEVKEMLILLNLDMDKFMTGSLLFLGNLNFGFYEKFKSSEKSEFLRQAVNTINDIFNVSGYADFNKQGLWYNAQTFIVRHMNNVKNYHQNKIFEFEKEFYFGCEHLGNWKRRYVDIVYPVIMDKDAYGVIEYIK